MKKLLLFFFCLIFLKALGQGSKEPSILTNTKNWKKEIINFPVDWAPKVKLIGFEELLFTPNWKTPNHKEFWSLVMAWSIDAKSTLPINLITKNFQGYFDGLMKPNHWATNFPAPKIEELTTSKNADNFNFTMTFFDGFHTGKVITAHVKAKQVYCEIAQKAITIFYISPQNLESTIWKTLEERGLNIKFCNPKEKANLIALDSTWKKEIFPFPIRFAPQLSYKGFEEARFPPIGWLDEHHPNFWSYAFAWKIDAVDNLNAKKLTENLKVYFDGLSNNNDFKTSASIKKIKSANNVINFKGSVTIYDKFTTNKPLTLNVLIEKSFCKETEKSILLFKFSPKGFDHKTWQLLQKIELNSNVCN